MVDEKLEKLHAVRKSDPNMRELLPGVYTFKVCDLCNNYGLYKKRSLSGVWEEKPCPNGCIHTGK